MQIPHIRQDFIQLRMGRKYRAVFCDSLLWANLHLSLTLRPVNPHPESKPAASLPLLAGAVAAFILFPNCVPTQVSHADGNTDCMLQEVYALVYALLSSFLKGALEK